MFLLIVLCCIQFTGCDPYADRYPYLTGSKWISSDPEITLEYAQNDSGRIDSNEVVEWNGKTISISIGFRGSQYWVLPAESHTFADKLFSGAWKYSKGDLVLTIEEDNFFDGAYTELRFKKVQ